VGILAGRTHYHDWWNCFNFRIFCVAFSSTVENNSVKSEVQNSTTLQNPTRIETNLSNKPQTILLVEDEPAVLELVRTVLRSEGYCVRDTGDPLLAINLASAPGDGPDLLLTDVSMPALTGPELARAVHAASPRTRILFMTAHAAALDRELGIPANADVLRKPFRIGELAERVRIALTARVTAIAC